MTDLKPTRPMPTRPMQIQTSPSQVQDAPCRSETLRSAVEGDCTPDISVEHLMDRLEREK